ncbi:MAG: transcription-repair coupling factor [Deltaproteobacteria bacterium HGW-Deltaproteobacteria-2]|nr:MAG: transcription-repair coupling factor [Deltaproteobacteria bacterium HGW-Deltaproteobacteria-2]
MRKIITKKNKEDIKPLYNLTRQIEEGIKQVNVSGLKGAARSFLISLLFERLEKPLLVICPEEKEAAVVARNLALFLGEGVVFYYPSLDFLTIDMFALQREEELARLEALTSLQVNTGIIVVTSVIALMQKVMPVAQFNQYLQIISTGDTINRDDFCSRLMSGGYKRVGLVEEKGEFSIRGNLIDIFPPAENNPLRLEMVGDEIESIRTFDASSQRSIGQASAFVVPPSSEVMINPQSLELAVRNIRRRAADLALSRETRDSLVDSLGNGLSTSINPIFLPLFYETYDDTGFSYNKLSSLFNYLPTNTLMVLDNPLAINQSMQNAELSIDKLLFKTKNSGKFYLEKENAYIDPASILTNIDRFGQISLEGLNLDQGTESAAAVAFETCQYVCAGDLLAGEIKEDAFLRKTVEKINSWLADGMMILFFCPDQEALHRMKHLLLSYDLPVQTLSENKPTLEIISQWEGKSQLLLLEGEISTSFIIPVMKLACLSEEEIFVKKAPRRRTRPTREGYFLKSFGDLKEGDFVVHTDFGIGVYRGLKKITVRKIENDFLVIEYADSDKLYIPVNSLDRIQRYLGPEGYVPKIDRMGGSSWEAVKEKVKKSVREYAEELVSIYAAREALERKSFTPPDRIYEEFCSTFEFEETPDQVKAIEDIHLDMDDGKPMDRLICGDAGFGKTEVAIRSAFRAVMDGKQVAVLVPTTILAEQHYQTFSRRFNDFPVHVEVLNRFKSVTEQKKIIQELKSQKVDIVVGTHRLLQKDVEFKDLGLVIIDEEQRFGVSHKEKLKKMRTLVDVLTLSATPIPRTLHLSLIGIRDLSIINTPPEDRVSIKTYVLEFDEDAIKTAIEKELSRQGQVFFVHDRVRSIYSIARLIQSLVPQARIEVVHGQMKPAEIEKAMAKFVRQECDVLVCTTIIGSGLDIPTANTIIINRAEKFGLAQLYQIRGRVGRSNQEAFAYLLLPRGAMLSREAMKRLQVIKEFSEPGSGFRIAYNDLEIRGGGNLLGISQSGHISAVGYELYTELMEKTVREIKGEKSTEEELMPEIQLGISAFIPEEYVQDVHHRLVLYKRISLAENEEDIDQIRSELQDCYGKPPQSVDNLLQVINIRNYLKPLKGKKMGYDGKYLYIFFLDTSPVDPAKIISLYRKKIKDLRFTPDCKLFVPAPRLTETQILEQADLLLKMLAQ